jgi:hypothetical protein
VARLYSSPSTRVNDLAILAMRLALDRSEGSSPRPIQAMYLSRQSSMRGGGGGWDRGHGHGHVRAVPLEQGEHERLVRGVLVHRLHACWVRGSPRGFLLTQGCRLEVDGRSGDVPRKNVRGDGDPP